MFAPKMLYGIVNKHNTSYNFYGNLQTSQNVINSQLSKHLRNFYQTIEIQGKLA